MPFWDSDKILLIIISNNPSDSEYTTYFFKKNFVNGTLINVISSYFVTYLDYLYCLKLF